MAIDRPPCPQRAPKNPRRGEAHHRAELTAAEVLEIRRQWRLSHGHISQAFLARVFGVDRRTIHVVVRGETWKHLNNGE